MRASISRRYVISESYRYRHNATIIHTLLFPEATKTFVDINVASLYIVFVILRNVKSNVKHVAAAAAR